MTLEDSGRSGIAHTSDLRPTRPTAVTLAAVRPGTASTVHGDEMAYGLAGMRERAALIGGTFDLRSQPFEGTRIVVDVPIQVGAMMPA